MKNNINEAYCSFEVSKLLKEKGLEPHKLFGYVTKFYEPNTQSIRAYGLHGRTPIQKLIYRPSHTLAVEWLKVNFGIQLFLDYTYYDGFHYGYRWVKYNGDYGEIWNDDRPCGYNTPQEATEAALLYVLNNLI